MTENAESKYKNNQKLIHEIEQEIKKLAIDGLSAEAIGDRIKKKYGKSIKELTGKNLTTILGFRKRGFQAISGAKLVLKLKQDGLLDSWVSLSKLMNKNYRAFNSILPSRSKQSLVSLLSSFCQKA